MKVDADPHTNVVVQGVDGDGEKVGTLVPERASRSWTTSWMLSFREKNDTGYLGLGLDCSLTGVVPILGYQASFSPFSNCEARFRCIIGQADSAMLRRMGAVAVSVRALIYHRSLLFRPLCTRSLSFSPCSSTMKAFDSLPVSIFPLFLALLLVPQTIAGQ
jgi:hypothetical protein